MEKDKLWERLRKSVDELFASIENLDSRKNEVFEKTKVKYHEVLSQVKEVEARLEAKSQQAKQGHEPGWDEAKRNFNQSLNSFREAMENLIAFIKKSPSEKKKDQDPEYHI